MTSQSPTISVVVPVWNEEKYLQPCIDSLKNQTFKDFDVVALDNHSTDATISMCKKAGWRVVQQKQKGISAARSEGFASTHSSIIASTNADCIVPANWLETLLKEHSEPDVACVFGPVVFKENDTAFQRTMNKLALKLYALSHTLKIDHPTGENFAVKRKFYDQVGGYNVELPTAEDVDLGYRISKVGRMVFVKDMVVYSSNRRMAKQGPRFFIHHIYNFILLRFFGKASSDFDPIR